MTRRRIAGLERSKRPPQLSARVRPDASIWVWNDMFRPDAQCRRPLLCGKTAPSPALGKGLDKDVGIVNWNGGPDGPRTANSSPTSASGKFLSGYYDGDENGGRHPPMDWTNTKFIPGIAGAMYTTWEAKYIAMSPWAQRAWGLG